MLHYIYAYYYPHHPNMMVWIYNIIITHRLSYHVGEFQKVINLNIDVFLFCNYVKLIFCKENCEGTFWDVVKTTGHRGGEGEYFCQ